MNPERERVMAREANPWGTMWVGMSTCTASRELQYFCRKHQYQRDCIQVLGGREHLEIPWVSTKKMWFMYMAQARCWEEITLICLLYMLIRFIYGYSNMQQLYFAIWFSSFFLLDLHPWTPGGFCRHWQEDGAATRAKERAIAADKRGQVILVSTNCAISPCETPVGMIQGLGMEEVMMIPWKRRFVVRSDIDESCLASPSGTNRMGKVFST